MNETIAQMHALACEARDHAYAPYSKFKVGACLRAEDGSLFVGCNVENAAYPDSLCAEACAIGALIAAGKKRISEVVIVADTETICSPCGSCRQKLSEFIQSSALVYLADLQKIHRTMTIADLLPLSFSSTVMQVF